MWTSRSVHYSDYQLTYDINSTPPRNKSPLKLRNIKLNNAILEACWSLIISMR